MSTMSTVSTMSTCQHRLAFRFSTVEKARLDFSRRTTLSSSSRNNCRHFTRLISGMRWFRSAESNGRTGCNGRGGGGGLGLETGVVVIVPSTRTLLNGIKQLSEPQECATIDRWLFGRPDTRANDFVEHPSRYAPGRVVRESYIDHVALTARTSENIQLLTEQRMVGVENSC